MSLVRMRVRSYRDLIVWQKSIQLVLDVYRYTEAFSKSETYGLVSQLRRASVSIPSNIAEGYGRLSAGEYKHFLGNARGSLVEVETQVIISEQLNYLAPNQSKELLNQTTEVGKILNGLINSLKP